MRKYSSRKSIFADMVRAFGKSPPSMGRREIVGISILAVFSVIGFCMASVMGNLESPSVQVGFSDYGMSGMSGVPGPSGSSGRSNGSFPAGYPDMGSNPGDGTEHSFSVGSNSHPFLEENVTGKESDIYFPLRIEGEKTPETMEATLDFFKGRIPFLTGSLQNSGFLFEENVLDTSAGTTAYIIARNENCAQNLNGYFYYLFDEKGASTALSPFVLNIATLFEEENRKTVTEAGTFAEPKHAKALRDSLIAALGLHYSEEVYDFIMAEYVRTFRDRLNGAPLQTPVVKIRISGLEAVFHNSFLTYVEFYIDP